MPDYKFTAYFRDDDSNGLASLTVTANIRNNETGASVETGITPTNVGDGAYSVYRDLPEADYICFFKTASNGHEASLGILEIPRIDAAVSSRSTLTQADILSDATPFSGAFIDAAISTVCGGPGSAPYEIIINDPDGNPLDGVNVWITTDLAGTNIIFNGYTDTFGKVTPMLDAGDYFAWKQLAGYTFTNPQAFSAP